MLVNGVGGAGEDKGNSADHSDILQGSGSGCPALRERVMVHCGLHDEVSGRATSLHLSDYCG